MEKGPETDYSVYQIRLRGMIHPSWLESFEGLQIMQCAEGETLLYGYLPDQAALHGLLNRILDLNIPLLSVCEVSSTGEHGDGQTQQRD